jgi:hypothetical protein
MGFQCGRDNNIIEIKGMNINDEDIQVLMKITLLTPTNKKLKAIIPYLKKFCPKVDLLENVATFIPLFHTLQIDASS